MSLSVIEFTGALVAGLLVFPGVCLFAFFVAKWSDEPGEIEAVYVVGFGVVLVKKRD